MKAISCESSFAIARRRAAIMAAVALTMFGRAEGASTGGAVITAASMSRADVGAAVAAANDGDTVVVPAGLATWTNSLIVSNAITLSFAGAGQSTILDAVIPVGRSSEAVIALMPTNTNVLARLTGLQVQGAANEILAEHGAIQLGNGTAELYNNIRVDHCVFTNLSDDNIYSYNCAGVIDHCAFYENAANESQHAIALVNGSWAGGTLGDGSWTAPATLGTSNALYVENCSFTGPGPDASCFAFIDAFNGGRYVVRYCNISNAFICAHGTDSSGRERGTRSVEIYMNSGFDTNWGNFIDLRSSTGVIWSNTMTGYQTFALLSCYRASTYYLYWGGITGTNQFDENAPENASGPVTTVTHVGANHSKFLVVTNVWTANQYLGYTAIDLNTPSGYLGPTNNNANTLLVTNFSAIKSNAAWNAGYTTNYFLAAGDNKPAIEFNTGDTVAIYAPALCGLDMTGTGLSGPLNRDVSGNPLGPWPTNAVEPVYGWGNTLNGTDGVLYALSAIIRPNVHYFNDIPKPGYVPFTYPHPLTLIGTTDGTQAPPADTPPAAPTNLRIATSP